MGKLITFISIVLFLDLFFLATGQLGLSSPTASLINIVQNPANINASPWWTLFILGVSGLAAFATVVVGIVSRQSDQLIFIPMALSIGTVLIGDLITIYNILAQINKPLAILAMSPLMIIVVAVVVEWVKNKD